jgi:hypothetical protein
MWPVLFFSKVTWRVPKFPKKNHEIIWIIWILLKCQWGLYKEKALMKVWGEIYGVPPLESGCIVVPCNSGNLLDSPDGVSINIKPTWYQQFSCKINIIIYTKKSIRHALGRTSIHIYNLHKRENSNTWIHSFLVLMLVLVILLQTLDFFIYK